MHDGVLGERVGDEDANPIALDRLDGRGRRLNVVARKASDHAGGDLSLHRLDDELAQIAQGPERDIDAITTREAGFDPDLWVIEIESRDGRTLLDQDGLA